MLWLVGAGSLALEYHKVLKDLNEEYLVIGRGKNSAQNFLLKTGIQVTTGGLSNFLNSNPTVPQKVIVAVNVEELKSACINLINYGVKEILLEKPGGVDTKEVRDLYNFAKKKKVNIMLAYNRRYYNSVIKVKDLIKIDGGLQSFNFEFTEWTHKSEKFINKNNKVFKKLVFC